jgi:hypothetical protein
LEREDLRGKNDDGRNADRRLANHRLQPVGHLTPARMLSIYDISVYEAGAAPTIVPDGVSCRGSECLANSQRLRLVTATAQLVA